MNSNIFQLNNILVRVLITLSLSTTYFMSQVSPSYAHAEMSTINIADGSHVTRLPDNVVLTFNEIVTGKEGSLQLLNSTGKILLRSGKINSDTATLKLGKLKPDRYVVRWGVISADGHPIAGATSFAYNLKTNPGPTKKYDLKDSITGKKHLVISLYGDKVGKRVVSINGISGEGTIELRNKLFGAPFIWKFSIDNGEMIASGMLPASGNYDVTVRVRTSVFDEVVNMGVITIKK
jgi:methionine-rich copper-binding protein CopC